MKQTGKPTTSEVQWYSLLSNSQPRRSQRRSQTKQSQN